VLVGRWTGSMGEGLAMGFDATGTGTVVGTRLAGLVGATTRIELSRTGIGISVPFERLYHVDGTPREAYQPPIVVDVTAAAPGRDPFIEAALGVLAAR
jgi:carboxyl-terminal processing protease